MIEAKKKPADESAKLANGVLPRSAVDGTVALVTLEPGLPPFPPDVFPPMLRAAVVAYARGVEAPFELAALPAMAVLSSALGPRWRVAATPGLVRAPLVWLCQVASSGSAKGPASRPVIAPVVEIDRRLREEHDEAMRTWRAAEAARRRTKKRAAGDEQPADAGEDPPRRRYAFVTNATIEALLGVLQDAEGHGVLYHSDEVRTLLDGLDGYRARGSQGRGEWLSLWDGAPTRLIRKGAENAECDRPFVAVLGGVQPGVLPKLSLKEEDGLMPRFMWAHVTCAESGLGDGVEPHVADVWTRAVRLAADHPVTDLQPFTPEGRALLDARKREWSGRAIELEGAGLGLLAGFYGKATDNAVRLTALLHGFDAIEEALQEHKFNPPALRSRTVPASTVRRALQLADYFLAHGAHTTRIVSKPVTEGTNANEAASLAAALRTVVAPGATLTDTPAGWVGRVAAGAGLKLSPVQAGKRFIVLEADPPSGLVVTRLKSGPRTWTVRRSR